MVSAQKPGLTWLVESIIRNLSSGLVHELRADLFKALPDPVAGQVIFIEQIKKPGK